MKLISKTTYGLSFLLAASSVAASQITPFVGVQFSQATATQKATLSIDSGSVDYGSVTYAAGNSFSASEDLNATTTGFKLGVVLENDNRVYLQRASYSENGGTVDLTTVNYDYVFASSNGFKPYLGANVGQSAISDALFSKNGTAIGVQAGILATLQKSFELDASIGYTKLGISDSRSVTVNGSTSVGGTSVDFNNSTITAKGEIESAVILNIGLNYKF
jgi:outer membrane protein W